MLSLQYHKVLPIVLNFILSRNYCNNWHHFALALALELLCSKEAGHCALVRTWLDDLDASFLTSVEPDQKHGLLQPCMFRHDSSLSSFLPFQRELYSLVHYGHEHPVFIPVCSAASRAVKSEQVHHLFCSWGISVPSYAC